MDVIKYLAKLLPLDESDTAGYGPFRLPKSARWMEPVFEYHDYYYRIGPDAGMRLSDIDWRIFKALTIAAEQAEDPIERCKRATQICRYWRIMRVVGRYLYGRHKKKRTDGQ